MEKVSRKVSCKERFPKLGNYLIQTFTGNKEYALVHSMFDWEDIEYWYEEVYTNELEDYKVAVGNLQMIIEMDALKAEERYKHAKTVLIDLNTYFSPDESNIVNHIEHYIDKALRIGSGLEESKVK